MSNRLTIILGQALIAISMMFTACGTDVELCEKTEHPHVSKVKFAFDWAEGAVKPDSMYVIAYRVMNNSKSVLAVNAENSFGRYIYNAPVFEETIIPSEEDIVDNPEEAPEDSPEGETGDEELAPEEESGAEEQPSSAKTRAAEEPTQFFDVKTGTYKFIAFNVDTTRLDCKSITDVVTDNAESDAFWVEYKSFAKDSEQMKGLIPNWKDFNNYADYVLSGMQPLYYASSRKILEGQSFNCEFVPSRITQNLGVRFNISKAQTTKAPFVIDSVKAEISGIPYKFNLANGYIDITKTYKMLLDVDFIDTELNVIEDTPENKYLRCYAKINVPTIVHAESTKATTGPGIMQIIIYTHLEGESKVNIIQGKINLYNTLTKAGLYSYVDEHRFVKRKVSSITLGVNTSLVIDGKKLSENEDSGAGLDQWTSEGDIIIGI